jgi:Protein of unknown function (DUF3108)
MFASQDLGSSAGPAPGTLLVVCGLVLLLHLALLQSVAANWHAALPALKRPLVVRSIALNVPASPAATESAPVNASVPTPTPAAPPNSAARTPPAPPATLTATPQVAAAVEIPTSLLPDASVNPALTATEKIADVPAASAISAPVVPVAAATASASPQAQSGPAITLPGSARLKYEVQAMSKGLPYQASAELLWRHDGAEYEARMEVSAFLVGSRTQTSQGRVGPSGLVPLRFANKTRSEQAAHFDYPGNRIRFSANTPDAPLLPGTQDRVSVVLQLSALVAGDPALYSPGSRISLPTVGQRDIDTWVFELQPAEQLSLPGGEQMALKLIRQPRREFDITVEIWLAPAQGYLPVRIKLTQANGDFVDQLWRSTAAP